MADELSTEFKVVNYAASKGLDTVNDPTNIGDADFSSLLNIRFSRFGFGPRLGMSIVGANANNASTNTGVKSLFYYEKSNGSGVVVRSHTTFLEWLDTYGTDTWRTIQSGLTTDLPFGFAPFNKAVLQLSTGQTADNNLMYCNGTETYRTWNGAVGHIASTTATTITLINEGGSDTLFSLGFDDPGSGTASLSIGGVTYTYDGSTAAGATDFSTLIFRGVSPSAASLTIDTPVIQLAATSGSNNPRGNILATAYGRILTSKNNATTMYYSASGDETTFTAGNDYGNAGLETFIEGNGGIQSIISSDGKVYVFKKHAIIQWLLTIFAATTSTSAKRTEHNIIEEGYDNGAASRLSVVNVNKNVYFITPKGQIRLLGNETPLTNRILPSLGGFNSVDAALAYDPKQNWLLASIRGVNSVGQTAPQNDTIIMVDLTRGAVSILGGVTLSCFTWDAGAERMLAGDVSNPLVYEMNVDGVFSDEISDGTRVPIVASAITKRQTYGLEAIDKGIRYYMVKGYILPTAEIQVDFRFNQGGIKDIKTKTITGNTDNKYVFTRTSHTIGSREFGDVAFGAEDTDSLVEGMNPFQVYLEIPITDFNDMEVMFTSVAQEGNGWWIRQAGGAIVSEGSFDPGLVI